MAQLVGVDVAHVLEAAEIGTFPGGRNVETPEISRQKGQAIESERMELGTVGNGLLDGVSSALFRAGGLSGSPSSPGRPRLGLLAGGPPSLG